MVAITWRNIDAPDFTGASRILGESQKMFDSGFGKLGQIIEQQQKQDQINVVAERNSNSSKYLDSVAALAQQGPEALEQAIKSGAVNRLRESFGPNIDADRIRGAAEQMLSQRMQQAKQGVEFNNFMVDEKQKPIRDAWRVAGLKGDKETQARLEQENPNLRNMAELYTAQRGIDHENVVWDEDKKEYVRRQGKYEQDIKASNAQISYQQGMLANAQAQTRIQGNESTERIAGMKEDRALRAEERLNKMLVEVQEKYGDTFKSNPNSEKSIIAQLEVVNKLPEKARELALAAVNKARTQPGATQGSVLAVAMASTPPEYLSTDGGQINRAVKSGEAVREANVASGSELANEARRDLLGNRMKVIQSRLESLPGNKLEGTPATGTTTTSGPAMTEQEKAAVSKAVAGTSPAPAPATKAPVAEVAPVAKTRAQERLAAAEAALKSTPTAYGKGNPALPEYRAAQEAVQAEARQIEAAKETAAKLARQQANEARVAEANKRNEANWTRQRQLNEAASAKVKERAELARTQKVTEAQAEVDMLKERVRLSGAPVHKANLREAEERLKKLSR